MIGSTNSTQYETYRTPSELLVLLKGRIVLEDCDRLRAALIPEMSRGSERIFIDLSQVDYIDSAGLGLLVGFKMTSKKSNSRIILLEPTRAVADILYVSKLDGIFEFLSGAEAAAVKSRLTASGNTGEGTDMANESRLDTAFPDIRPDGSAVMQNDTSSSKEQVEEHCRRAVDYMRQGNYEMSVEEYRNALAIDPEYLPALNNLAIVYEKQPSWIDQAIEQWEKVEALSQQRGDAKHEDRAARHLANLRRMQS